MPMSPAAQALRTMLDLDTSGEVAARLRWALTREEEFDYDEPYAHAVALLCSGMEIEEFNDLMPRVDLCPWHAQDLAICDDDDETECATLRTDRALHLT